MFPINDLHLPSIVSVDHLPERVFLSNIMSDLYLQLRGRVALRKNRCVVFLRVDIVCGREICHLSLKSSGDTSV